MNLSLSSYCLTINNATTAVAVLRFAFTGKERDEETGYGYFGARYYDATLLTGWTAVDPMADKYPNTSPYAYCAWNPVKLVDPDGREVLGSDDWWKNRNSDGTYSLFFTTITWVPGETMEFEGEIYDWVGNSDTPPVNEYGIPNIDNEGAYQSNAPWIGYANKELMDEKNNHESPKGTNKGGHIDMYMRSCGLQEGNPWCAGFINWCLTNSGYDGAGANGKAYKNWRGGINIDNSPEYGSIAIFNTGHVGFVIGITEKGTLDIIHGNWSDRIQRNDYIEMSDIVCFVRPTKKQ